MHYSIAAAALYRFARDNLAHRFLDDLAAMQRDMQALGF